MAKKRGSFANADQRTRVDRWTSAVALAGIAFLLSWPFLIAPGKFLYIRYFDADTLFGPWWKLHNLVSVWDAQLHLGYAHARDLSYLSIQEIASVLMTPLGADFRNRSSLICVSLLIFFGFWWYLRVRFPRVPGAVNALAAFFYAGNPFVVAFIHDGYSGLLVDYALLPISLLIVEWARRTDRPVFVSFIPLIFVLTGMYNLTSVLVALIGVIVLEYRYLYEALRFSRAAAIATTLAFALNIFWFVPLLYDLTLHPSQPILAESGNDISVLTSAGTLTNTFLMCSYPEIWTKAYGTRECTGCAFYESPWFMIAMLFVAVCALAGLIRAKRYGLLSALVASILIATGYHYQNEIIGIPYVVLMGLPLFDAFRSNVKFSALTAAFYGLGLVYFYLTLARRRALFATVCTIAVTLIAFPYVFGNIVERSSDNPPHFPNFVVTIPPYFAELHAHGDLLPHDSATLLLPNTPFGAYIWGAYGNDLLPPYLGKPTISVSYLPQPSWQLELILQKMTAARTPRIARRALMTALGINRSLYRDDAAQSKPLPKSAFGAEIARFGAFHLLSGANAFPRFFVTTKVDPVVGVTGIAMYAGLWKRVARGFDASDARAVCAGAIPLGLEPAAHHHTALLDVPLNCSAPVTIRLALSLAAIRELRITDAAGGHILPNRWSAENPHSGIAFAQWEMPPGPHRYELVMRDSSQLLLAIAARGRAAQMSGSGYFIRSVKATRSPLGYRFDAQPLRHYLIFNENFDPTWQGIVQIGGHWQRVPNFMVDGFANAWSVPPKSPLIIFNVLLLVVWVSAGIALALFLVYLYVLRAATHSPAR